ncbi:LamG domain-containing protein [Flexithrix dorotheae]|uniref:LamG domain-containing protein n=1 Tax=Flexithrix dorotheae TaxID=70993 RepID=UPI00036C15B3|nr:PKD domain-containing protein [Flexithrix dorotheae]
MNHHRIFKKIIVCFIPLIFLFTSCEENEEPTPEIIISFVADIEEISEGLTINFSDSSEGNPTKWIWTFEGGLPSTSTEQNPKITYEEPGNYDVTLVASNENKSSILTKKAYIKVIKTIPELKVSFSVDKEEITQGLTVNFSDSSAGNPTNWIWTFEGGTPSTSREKNPEITYEHPGNYDVTLVASNENKSSILTKKAYITVLKPNPELKASFSSDLGNIYQGQTITFSDSSAGNPTNWIWTFEGGTPSTSTERNPKITYEYPGNYDVTLIASNENKSSILTKKAYITVLDKLDSGLVAYYPFNENVLDESGNGNNGELNGPTPSPNRQFLDNSAYYFDGVNDFIEIPNSSSFIFNEEFTISTWVKAKSFNTNNCESNRIIEKGDEKKIGSWGLYYDDNIGNNGCGQFDPNKMRFKFGLIGKDGIRYSYGGKTNIVTGEWYFVTGIYDGEYMKLYINGQEEFSQKINLELGSNTAPITIGKHQNVSFPYYLNGVIDDIRIYNRALQQSEIKELLQICPGKTLDN